MTAITSVSYEEDKWLARVISKAAYSEDEIKPGQKAALVLTIYL